MPSKQAGVGSSSRFEAMVGSITLRSPGHLEMAEDFLNIYRLEALLPLCPLYVRPTDREAFLMLCDVLIIVRQWMPSQAL